MPALHGSGIYKTTDGGKTWKPINTGLPEAKFRGRIGLDICLTKPNVLYAFVDNYEMAREPTAKSERPTPTASPRPASSRGPRSTVRTTRARPGRRSAA